MGKMKLAGVLLAPLKIIAHPQGNIFHGLKNSDPGYCGFGEAYFSAVHADQVKAWKKHLRMTLNLVVPSGAVKFVLFDDRPGSRSKGYYEEQILSSENYQRLTVPPGIWFGFKGMSSGLNLILNVADLPHDPEEVLRAEPSAFPYEW